MLERFSFYPVLFCAFSSVLAVLLTSQVDYKTEMENNGNFNPNVREKKSLPCSEDPVLFQASLERNSSVSLYLCPYTNPLYNSNCFCKARGVLFLAVFLCEGSIFLDSFPWLGDCWWDQTSVVKHIQLPTTARAGGEQENTVAGAGSRRGSCGFSAGNSWLGELWESPD